VRLFLIEFPNACFLRLDSQTTLLGSLHTDFLQINVCQLDTNDLGSIPLSCTINDKYVTVLLEKYLKLKKAVDFMSIQKKLNRKANDSVSKTAEDFPFNKTVESLARFGYATRGLIYFVIGLLTTLLAFGYGGKTTDQQGAIAMIGKQPFGRQLLWLVLIGLVCYSLWGLIRAILNPLHKTHDVKGYAIRVGYFVSGIGYLTLVLPTYGLISGGSQPAQTGVQQDQIQKFVASVLAIPLGKWLVGIIGIIVILVGLYQFIQGFIPVFEKQIILVNLTPVQVKRVNFLGRFGTVSRGIIFSLIGIYLVYAAYMSNSKLAKGFDSAMTSILQQPFGRWFMGIIALGLISLGLYSLCVAIFFRLKK